MTRPVVLEFYRGSLKFSAGHFTIFSATERERLHGHNYLLEVKITTQLNEPGISFDYQIFRDYLTKLCQQLHLFFLLPARSPYLEIKSHEHQYEVIFNHQSLFFPKTDALLLPLYNITLEELSHWFVEQLVNDRTFMNQYHINGIIITCFNGNEHGATSSWTSTPMQ